MYYLGIDLGGTNIVAGVVNSNYKIIAKSTCKTAIPRPEIEICKDMANLCFDVLKKAKNIIFFIKIPLIYTDPLKYAE